jgi:subtilisin family serine protease
VFVPSCVHARLRALALAVAAALILSLSLGGALISGAGQLPELTITPPSLQVGGAGERVQVLIELREEPAAVAFARVIDGAPAMTAELRRAAGAAGQTQAQQVLTQQVQVTSAIGARGIALTEMYRVQKSMNAIAAEVEGGSIAQLRQVPGVKAVHLLQLEYPMNGSVVPFTGTPPVWANTLGLPAGATGTGIRVAVIDTGVDYLHATFGGSGLLADYTANNRTAAPDAYYPNAKVVGGTDFAGDNYNGNTATIAPDPDPMDCNGHGTHVAGTAAGFGVNADGTTYGGTYGPSTPFSSLRIGPGSAPHALVYALRVFGCGGGTNLTVQAIEWAMDPNGDTDMSDHLDVINMSLGSSLGSLTSTTTIAAENAAAIGIVVVAAAGNNGDTYTVNGAPSVSNRTISVGASVDAGVSGQVRVNSPAGIAGFKAVGIALYGSHPPAGGLTGIVEQALDVADGVGPATTDGCSALTNAGAIAGRIAIIDRGGTCGFVAKTKNAQDAGAIGVIIANNVAGAPGNMSGTDPTVVIPTVMVSQTDGNAIKTNLAAPVNVTLFSGADTLASFSSRGPAPGFRLKPDIVAPGSFITSAQTGTTCTGSAPSTGCQTVNATGFIADSQPLTISGTSMATPHVAGVMALLRQLHPDWSVEQLKALAMNTATHDVTTSPDGNGSRYGAGRVGAGRVDASSAAGSSVVAFNATEAGAVSVSFDTHLVGGTATEVKRIRILNAGGSPATYDLGIDTVLDAPGVTFSLPGSSTVTVPAHSSVEIEVQLDAEAALMDHVREASVSGTQTVTGTLAGLGTLNRQWITEETGHVTLSQSGSLKLRVPLYATARPASAMSAAPIVTGGAPTGSTTIPLSGTGVCTGTLSAGPTCTGTFTAPTYDVASLVSPFQLHAISPRSPVLPAYRDIQYGGVQFDSANSRLIFGVSMWGAWTSPSDTTVNIYIDTNNDGTFDRILFDGNTGLMNTNLFGNSGIDPQDLFVNAALTIATLGVSLPGGINRLTNGDPGARDSAFFNSSVKFLSAPLSNLGVSGPFHYKILTCPGTQPLCQQLNGFHYDEDSGATPAGFLFDTANPGLNFNGTLAAQDLNGATLPVSWNTANLTAQGSPGALLLHHHNAIGMQAEVVPMEGTATTDLSVSITGPPTAPAKSSQVVLTVTASNLGTTDASSTAATVELPAGLTYVSDDGGGNFNSTTAVWTIGSLAGGATATLHVTATVGSTDAQLVSAYINAQAPLDPSLANNRSFLNVMAPRDADLAVTAVPDVTSALAGTPVTYTVTVRNLGDDPAFDLAISHGVIAGSAAFGAGAASAGVFDSSTGAWRIGTLGKGVTQTLTFSATALGGPTLTTRVSAASSIGDLNLANNVANASTTIVRRATSTAATIAAAVTAGQLTPVTVVVTDVESTGSKSNPTGTVTFGSTIPADTFIGTCTLSAVAMTTDQSSCQLNARFDSAGARTITATYGASATHATSAGTAPSSATCSFAVTPGTLSFASAGGSSSASVATASGCTWTGSSDASFTAVTGGASGTGNGTVTYQVAANPDATLRTATLTIAGQMFTVTQTAAPCTYSITPTSATFANAGGTGSVTVTTLVGCTTSAVSNSPFVTITNVGSGTSAVVSYSVAANPPPGDARTGTMTIGGHTFTVTQDAAPCTYAIAPTSATFSSAGGTGSVTVTTLAGCTVSAVSNASFITITNVGSGTSAVVAYSVAANPPPGAARSGTMTIGGQTFTVTQGAIGTLTLDRSSLTFAATNSGTALNNQTAAQEVVVDLTTPSSPEWTATVDQPWIQITPASGSGDGTFNVAVVHSAFLPPTGVVTGTVTVSAPGVSNSPRTIAVRLNLAATATLPPIGFLDTPAEGATGVQGGLAVTGWALDDVEVTHVRIYRDAVSPETFTGPVFVGEALFVPDARPDVEAGMPNLPFNYRAGWGMVVLTNTLPNGGTGTYRLHAFAEDREGHVAWIGSRSFTAANGTSTAPFGTLDTPFPGQTVSGVFANFGWALTPLPKTIPVDGSTIQVLIDGVVRGNPSYNHARPDVTGTFPGLNNSAGPVGAFVFDSRTLTNGLHTIMWIVRDDAGAETGIGSRFFRVQNSGTGSSITETAVNAAAGNQVSVAAAALRADEVGVRRASDADALVRIVKATGEVHAVTIRSIEPIEVHIGGDGGVVAAHSVVGNERRRLPVGSTLDAERGIFYWQPGAAFIGQYEFVFERGGVETRVRITVR